MHDMHDMHALDRAPDAVKVYMFCFRSKCRAIFLPAYFLDVSLFFANHGERVWFSLCSQWLTNLTGEYDSECPTTSGLMLDEHFQQQKLNCYISINITFALLKCTFTWRRL